MTERGPRAELIEFADIGHVPALMTDDQLEPVVEFLARDEALKAEPVRAEAAA